MIEASSLTRRFGDFVAVSQVSLQVDDGKILALLGPNGAGKTTTVRMLAALLAPSEGEARVAGYDVRREPEAVRASIGLLPFHACEHINATLANKLFEYMALGLPVVASDVPPMVRILEENRAGITFRSGDGADLANKIEMLAQDREARDLCGQAGRKASNERYNWTIDGARLVRAVECLGEA